ncbi:2'-5' RNA ligase family protein [Halodesulfurarchaeum sp.]|uniref:2'-5' RNA ligase family protein n=1 Tax=Halodesulfurarchaeum sp. TaxID=1980530 RepID=UPI001BC3BE93|nr:2'-5' RNA ligase family protein [Halodesulfurarchaeum sp.]
MYSVNVPVPLEIRELASQLRPALSGFDRIRPARTRTLVLKRLPATDRREYLHVARRAREALEGTPPFEAAVTGIETFWDPPKGPSPVAYLAVEGEGLSRIHDRLVAEFEAVETLEGPNYVPHVTLARGGPQSAPDPVQDREIEPVRFRVDTLELYDSVHTERVESISLPA